MISLIVKRFCELYKRILDDIFKILLFLSFTSICCLYLIIAIFSLRESINTRENVNSRASTNSYVSQQLPTDVPYIRPDQTIVPENIQQVKQLACWRNREHGYSSTDKVLFSSDSRVLASSQNSWSDSNSIINLWSTVDGKLINSINAHRSHIFDLLFLTNSDILLSSSEDATIRAWDLLTGKQLYSITKYRLRDNSEVDRQIVFTIDSDALVIIYSNGYAQLWNIQDGHLSGLFKEDDILVNSLSFSFDGRLLATGFDDGAVRLWDAQSRQLLLTLRGHDSRVRSIAFSSDDRLLASSAFDAVNLWDVQTGRLLHSWDFKTTEVYGILVSSNSRRIAVRHSSGVSVWDLESYQLVREFSLSDGPAALSPDGRMLAFKGPSNTIELWDIDANKKLQSRDGYNQVSSIVFSPDSRQLAFAASNGDVALWDIQTSQLVHALNPGFSPAILAISFDGRKLAAAALDGRIKVWDTATGQLIRSIDGHEKAVAGLALSSDGQMLASASKDQTVKLWNARTFQITQTIELENRARSVAFSPKNQILAYTYGKRVALWDVQNNQLIRLLEDHPDDIYNAVFSFDGHALAVVSGQGIHFYHTDSWTKFRLISTDAMPDVAFLPDSQFIATISGSKINIWNTRTGSLLHSLRERNELKLTSVAFAPDGRLLAAGTERGEVCVWGISSAK